MLCVCVCVTVEEEYSGSGAGHAREKKHRGESSSVLVTSDSYTVALHSPYYSSQEYLQNQLMAVSEEKKMSEERLVSFMVGNTSFSLSVSLCIRGSKQSSMSVCIF